ncbi:MAG: hypothetical protein H8D23_32180 [Candidatus Brocadiales bacterium]|nr:hypothetical protein [Candidatus Brocadiales bacterium]
MKRHCNVYMILIAVLMLIQQIMSGCTTTVTKDRYKKELHKEKVDLISQKLYQNKCSLCHELPDVDAYPYTPDQWASIIDIMHDTKAARKFITIEEEEKIKIYLGRISQTD